MSNEAWPWSLGPGARAWSHPTWPGPIRRGLVPSDMDPSWHHPTWTRPGTTLHATLGTPHAAPASIQQCTVQHVRHAGYVSVLWALNRECVTLKWHLKSFWSRLSDLWLPF